MLEAYVYIATYINLIPICIISISSLSAYPSEHGTSLAKRIEANDHSRSSS